MIVPMKKISCLVYHKEKLDFLTSLRDLGVMHIEEVGHEGSQELSELTSKLKQISRAIKQIETIAKKHNIKIPSSYKGSANPGEIIGRIESLENELEVTEQNLLHISKQIKQLEPWGDFNPEDISGLSAADIKVRFFEVSLKKFISIDLSQIPHEIIRRQRKKILFVVFEHGSASVIPAEEVVLPDISLSRAKKEFQSLLARKEEMTSKLKELVSEGALLEAFRLEVLGAAQFESARLNMPHHLDGKISMLTGWFPKEKEQSLKSFLEQYSSYYLIRPPHPGEDVPVLIKNNRFSRLFEPITKLFSLPSYYELDPTPFFAPFFAFFFGLCLGDLGYGLIIFLASLTLLIKGPRSFRDAFTLGLVLGMLSAISGVFLNTFFGQPIFDLSSSQSGAGSIAFLGATTTNGVDTYPAMPFAMVVGIMQIIFALVLQAVNKCRNYGWIYVIQPLSYIIMISSGIVVIAQTDFMELGLGELSIGPLAIGPWLLGVPGMFGSPTLIFGLLLLFLFNNPSKKLPLRLCFAFKELYFFVTGFLSDALSYLRLFALGLAGGLLGFSFNQIAFMIITEPSGEINYFSFKIIFTIMVLLFGHTLNLALAALGAFVHPLRLTFVEFYKNLDFKGSQNAFTAFKTNA